MATYSELRSLINDSSLRNRVTTAVAVAAQSVLEDPVNFPTTTADVQLQTDRLLWAARAFNDFNGEGRKFLISVLAANRGSTVSQIQGATDTQIQTNANASVDLFAQHDKPAVAA